MSKLLEQLVVSFANKSQNQTKAFPCYNFSDEEFYCLSFWYHNYGDGNGTLEVLAESDVDFVLIVRATELTNNTWKQVNRTLQSSEVPMKASFIVFAP